ncbi:MAG: hypothetical protein DRP01_10670 [Archaeoglobales archaeon]|nr:MAG: hypothetical protein DRP01_10670 [Archaeoglobales archaeon]
MGFLSKLAEWCRSNIPFVGGHIAWLVEQLESRLEEWLEPWFDKLSGVWDWFSRVKSELDEFARDPFSYIKSRVLNVLNAIVGTAYKGFTGFVEWVESGIQQASAWINSSVEWLKSQIARLSDAIWSAVKPFIEPALKWIESVSSEVNEFLKDPAGYIRSRISSWIEGVKNFILGKVNEARRTLEKVVSDVGNAFNGFVEWVKGRVSSIVDGVLSIDDFLASMLFNFIVGFAKWFLYTFLKDLFELEYDVEAGEVIGEYKNPITRFLVEPIEVEEPKYEYESIERVVRG